MQVVARIRVLLVYFSHLEYIDGFCFENMHLMFADTKPWRNYYLHHQRSYPIKKRKYFDHISDDYGLRTKMHRGKETFFFLFLLILLSRSYSLFLL